MAYNFKHRIEIVDKRSTGPLPGDEEEVVIAKPWADIKTMKGKEFNISKIAGNEGTSRFIIRYREGIKHNMKVKYKGLYYEIESITNDNENNHTITIIGNAILE